jgi:hypothetical protein
MSCEFHLHQKGDFEMSSMRARNSTKPSTKNQQRKLAEVQLFSKKAPNLQLLQKTLQNHQRTKKPLGLLQ